MAVMQAPGRAAASCIYVTAVDGEVLPGDEIAFGARKENERAEQIFRLLVALNGAARHGAWLRGLHVPGVFLDHRVAHGESRHQRVDPDTVLAELARARAGERPH